MPEQPRRDFVAACRRAFSLGLQMSTGGNISLRLDSGYLLVKPSGLSLCELEPDHLLVCDGEGLVVQGAGKPTKELRSHLAIYEARPEVGAVVHYHPPHATAYAVSRREIPLLTVHAKRILGRVPLVEAVGEGSLELASAVGKTFAAPKVKAALLAEHGIIAVGENLRKAQNLAELVEECARVALLSGLLRTIPLDGDK
ncbi:MAG: class II aldolase/adducin family protein [Desulfarculus sp.]|nr:class II aldolase/adducin family protein [Pseudomonadota bacterium]MBV1718055.1 class II aldolase/adducin family protein [Desulfarculus sp.]MBU4575768.1 class II aldolase/adducin family protein [Pseudomonadota bacterium]MBU4597560.1 class II aldolase/adducin family protein [Pseudomonadota bacterium]MBV1739294.1 class II aldolase/adducin family protein [Desulfarculus sp.]